jgi:hypothetical protein
MFPSPTPQEPTDNQASRPPTMNPPNFQAQQPMFPQDRPPVMPSQAPQAAPSLINQSVSQMLDQEISGMVMTRYDLSKTWRRPWRLIWDKCTQNMKAIYDATNKAAWQSRTFMPLTSKVVEVISANHYGALMGPETPVEWQTKVSAADSEVRSINELIQTDLDKCGFKPQMADLIRTNTMLGTSIGEVGYEKQTETVMVKQRLPKDVMDMMGQMGMDGGEQFVPKQMLVKDFATIKNVDIYDIYPEPRIQDFSKDHWVIHKSKITNRELKQGSIDADPYYKFDNVTDDLLMGSGMARTDVDPETQTRRYALGDYNAYTHFMEPDREHDLYTFFGLIPTWYLPGMEAMRNDKKHQYDAVPGCLKVVDRQYVIWRRLSPWRDGEPPYFKGNYMRIPGEFYGIGAAELVLGLQTEKNEIRNSRMDNINLSMNKILAVLKDRIPKGEWNKLVSEPGAIWPIKGVEDVKQAIQVIEMGDQTKDSWIASKEVDQEAQEATAAVKATLGVEGGGGDAGGSTFRGQQLNAQMATERWMFYARVLESSALLPAIKKFYQRIYQFKTYKDAVQVLGPERSATFQFLAPEDLELVAKLVPLGVMTMETKGVKLAQMAQYFQQISAASGPLPPWFKALEYFRKEWVEMGNPEPDSVLFSDQEMKQYNDMKKMINEEMSQMGGMGPMPQAPGGGQPQGNQGPPRGLVGPNGQPIGSQPPQSGQRGNSPSGMPISGNVPGPTHGMPRPALPARGPGASRFDSQGQPMS